MIKSEPDVRSSALQLCSDIKIRDIRVSSRMKHLALYFTVKREKMLNNESYELISCFVSF